MSSTVMKIYIGVLGRIKPVAVTIHYTSTPALRGSYEKGGRQLEPDSAPEFALHKVLLPNGSNIVALLNDEQIAALEKELTS